MDDPDQFDIEAWHRRCTLAEDPELEGIDPDVGTEHRPGTHGKLLVLVARYQLGVPLWHQDDFEPDGEDNDNPLEVDWLRQARKAHA